MSTDINQISQWLETLHSKLNAHREMRSKYNREMAFDFSPVGFFCPNENKVTEILAYFLRPNERHGQGDVYLKAFLALFDAKPEGTPWVSTQYYTTGGRPIDLVIGFPNGFMIGLESKIWRAQDQANQVRDYAIDLRTKSDGNFLMVYLHPDGKGAEVGEEDESKLRNMQYRECEGPNVSLKTLLEQWIRETQAQNVVHFLKSLLKYLDDRFPGGSFMEERTDIESFLMKHPELFLEVPQITKVHADIEVKIDKACWGVFCNALALEIPHTDKSRYLHFTSSSSNFQFEIYEYKHFGVCTGRVFCEHAKFLGYPEQKRNDFYAVLAEKCKNSFDLVQPSGWFCIQLSTCYMWELGDNYTAVFNEAISEDGDFSKSKTLKKIVEENWVPKAKQFIEYAELSLGEVFPKG